jgi:hypothetical protein
MFTPGVVLQFHTATARAMNNPAANHAVAIQKCQLYVPCGWYVRQPGGGNAMKPSPSTP